MAKYSFVVEVTLSQWLVLSSFLHSAYMINFVGIEKE